MNAEMIEIDEAIVYEGITIARKKFGPLYYEEFRNAGITDADMKWLQNTSIPKRDDIHLRTLLLKFGYLIGDSELKFWNPIKRKMQESEQGKDVATISAWSKQI